jgi:hypothetical protein
VRLTRLQPDMIENLFVLNMELIVKTSAAIVLFIPLLTLVFNVLAREWTDNSGRFSREAELASVKDGTVALKKTDGSEEQEEDQD